MLTIRKIKQNNNTECNSCGKVRKQYYEICYGIPVHDFFWQPYSTLPLCRSCLRRLSRSIEKIIGFRKAVKLDD